MGENGWLNEYLEAEMADIAATGRLRLPRTVSAADGPRVIVDGRRIVSFCSNDYLGLAGEPSIRRAASAAVEAFGAGATASRLISGTHASHLELERRFARCLGYPAGLCFGSGYHANLGLLGALAGDDSVVYSDAANHASIIDGIRLSKAAKRIYRHRDAAHLAELLEGDRTTSRRIIVTESLFSMDGDVAPLAELAELARRYGAALLVDEAHAFGTVGDAGRGLVHELGLQKAVDAVVVTCGKALGSYGAVVVGSERLRAFLVNRSRTFIFTTGLPAPSVAATIAALDFVERGEVTRRLRANVECFGRRLRERGFRDVRVTWPIVPIVIGSEEATMVASRRLWERGLWIQGIRPPTVAPGTSRLRLTLSAGHHEVEIAALVEALVEVLGIEAAIGSAEIVD
ncbi:MAG: 8-amino-7-oxononanoate synthase [Myxococcales bacterium]|nr:8-amino-7-oxononanoate synthase [Myxococcales bacterium]